MEAREEAKAELLTMCDDWIGDNAQAETFLDMLLAHPDLVIAALGGEPIGGPMRDCGDGPFDIRVYRFQVREGT